MSLLFGRARYHGVGYFFAEPSPSPTAGAREFNSLTSLGRASIFHPVITRLGQCDSGLTQRTPVGAVSDGEEEDIS